MFNQISLADYASLGDGAQTAGNYSEQDVQELLKAMSAGEITGRETTNLLDASGAPLKVESLENTLKILTNTPKHTPFFYRIGKKPATNTVEEYNQLVSYGELDGGFTLEGELPESADSIYRRKAQFVKYLGVVGGVTHPMQLVETGSGVSNMIAQETKNKVALMTKLIEGYLPFADSRIVPEHFNGFFAQQEIDGDWISKDEYQDSENVIDLRGSVLTDTAIEQGSLGVVNNYGIADLIISSPRTFSNFVTKYHNKKWIQPVMPQVRDGVFGQRVNEIITQNGAVEIMQSNFFKFSRLKRTNTLATSSKAPAAPVAGLTTPAVAVSDATARFANFTGDYYYAVTARNRYGESALTLLSPSLVTVVANQAVDLKFTAGTGAANAATGFCIYRTKVNPNGIATQSDFYKIFEVSTKDLTSGYDGAAAGLVRDKNRFLPDCDQALLVEWDADQVLAWKQLAPMMKMNLALLAPISRFMVLCYGTPILYAPRKIVRVINIGDVIATN